MKSAILAAAIAVVVTWFLKPTPAPIYERVEVPVEVIVEREPDTVRTFVDRVRTVQAPPEIIAISPSGGVREVQAFCKPVTLHTVDTVEIAPRLLLRSISHDPGWFWQRDQLTLTGPINTGDLAAFDFPVRAGFTARTIGDSVLVQYPRTSLLRDIFETFGPAFGVFLLMR